MIDREQTEARIAELRAAATMAHLEHCYEAPRAVIPNHSLHAVDFCPEINAALTALQRAERAMGIAMELRKRRPQAEPKNHGGRCWWCRWMPEAEAELTEALAMTDPKAMTDPRAEAEQALMVAVADINRHVIETSVGWDEWQDAVRAAYRAALVAELRAVADNPGYRSGCVCHSCTPLHARIAELEASG